MTIRPLDMKQQLIKSYDQNSNSPVNIVTGSIRECICR